MTRNPEARIDAAITQGGKTSKEDSPQSPPSPTPNAAQNAQGLACSPRPEWPELGYGIHAATGALLLIFIVIQRAVVTYSARQKSR